MSESRDEGKNSSVKSSSTESFTKQSFCLKHEHLATNASDSNTCNKQSVISNDQQQGFASVEFVQKAIDIQNDRFSRQEHAIKNLISGLQQTRPTSGRKRTRVNGNPRRRHQSCTSRERSPRRHWLFIS